MLKVIKPGVSERDIAAEITYRLLKHGAEGNSFDPIAVTGLNSSMPHGVPGDAVVKNGDFVTMDFGCIKNGYCSDMTRTVIVGAPTETQKLVYDTVLNAQLAGLAILKDGVSGFDADKAARDVIAGAGFGDCWLVDGGAFGVGTIVQTYAGEEHAKGDEKGYFKFGGSTVIFIARAGAVTFDADLVRNSAEGIETRVRCGERIGCAAEG